MTEIDPGFFRQGDFLLYRMLVHFGARRIKQLTFHHPSRFGSFIEPTSHLDFEISFGHFLVQACLGKDILEINLFCGTQVDTPVDACHPPMILILEVTSV